MWAVGLLVFFVFYRFAFSWYFNFFFFSNPLQRPLSWRSPWYHFCVLSAACCLLTASGYCFYLSARWMCVLPLLLLLSSFAVFMSTRGIRTVNIIGRAVKIQVRLERKGVCQSEINAIIEKEMMGEEYQIGNDLSFEDFLKYYVLSRQGLLASRADPETYMKSTKDVDLEIVRARRREESRA